MFVTNKLYHRFAISTWQDNVLCPNMKTLSFELVNTRVIYLCWDSIPKNLHCLTKISYLDLNYADGIWNLANSYIILYLKYLWYLGLDNLCHGRVDPEQYVWNCTIANLWFCLVGVLMSHSRMLHSYGDVTITD